MKKDKYIREAVAEADGIFHNLYEGTPILTGSIRPLINNFLKAKLSEAYDRGRQAGEDNTK